MFEDHLPKPWGHGVDNYTPICAENAGWGCVAAYEEYFTARRSFASSVSRFKELKSDVCFRLPNNGYLAHWADQGMLMLNAVLTVRAHQPNSHKNKGWEIFTDG